MSPQTERSAEEVLAGICVGRAEKGPLPPLCAMLMPAALVKAGGWLSTKCVEAFPSCGLMRSSENYMRDTRGVLLIWQQDGIVFSHADMLGASCCQRLIRPAIAAPRMGASQNSQSCAM
jgi:hypothetical protein